MLTLLVWLCVLPPLLALFYFSGEVLLGLRSLAAPIEAGTSVSIAVVIPAHDEAHLIAETVAAARHHISAPSQVVVIADNCSDATAELARSAGAVVVERNDPDRRGKGFALACARDFLSSAAPDAVFILDADCRIRKGSVETIASRATLLGEPVQAVNLLCPPEEAPTLVLVSNFAMLIKNLVRARGLYRLGGGITLFGTGMAFPWWLFLQLDLATGEAVEDLGFALSLAATGTRVHLDETVLVTSVAAALPDSLGQRSRWEHGFLAQAAHHAGPMLINGLKRRSRHLIALGAHLLVPPIALLFLVAMVTFLPALTLAAWAQDIWPLVGLLVAMGCAILATGIAWWLEGRATLPLAALVQAPLYILWKVPLYLRLLSARHTEWNRTRRTNEKS